MDLTTIEARALLRAIQLENGCRLSRKHGGGFHVSMRPVSKNPCPPDRCACITEAMETIADQRAAEEAGRE